MQDTEWGGIPQSMTLEDGRPKGMKNILQEWGINTATLNADDMRTILANHDDFVKEKTLVEHYLTDRGHTVFFIPKFHCELNPIERVWGQASLHENVHKLHHTAIEKHLDI